MEEKSEYRGKDRIRGKRRRKLLGNEVAVKMVNQERNRGRKRCGRSAAECNAVFQEGLKWVWWFPLKPLGRNCR